METGRLRVLFGTGPVAMGALRLAGDLDYAEEVVIGVC